jgi:uncharacterized membrane protein
MKTTKIVLFVSAFLASLVEGVEALTVVLATGTTRGWRSTLIGSAAALLALAGVIAILGPALAYVPLDVLRVIVGGLLLVFGLYARHILKHREITIPVSQIDCVHEDTIYRKRDRQSVEDLRTTPIQRWAL